VVYVPTTSRGQSGDVVGMISANSTHFFYCAENFQGAVIYTYPGISSINPNPYGWINQQYGANTYWIPYWSGYDGQPVPGAGWMISNGTETANVLSNSLNTTGYGPSYIIYLDADISDSPNITYLQSPQTGNIWQRVAWSGDTW